jgi:hypothetical protein
MAESPGTKDKQNITESAKEKVFCNYWNEVERRGEGGRRLNTWRREK